MDPGPATGTETQRLVRFQVQGNAAERYERWVVPFVVGPRVPALLDLADVRPCERVLDIATGTGVAARLAARRVSPGGSVVGLDLNEARLEEAARLPLPPALTFEWRQGSALALPFADAMCDVVLCQQGLQFFPDRLGALSAMRRVLTPGGRVAVSVRTGQSDAFFGLMMLVGTDGNVRGRDEWAAIFTAGGFALDSITPTASRFHILEGHPSI